MPVWNGERYLRDAVDSILNQTFTEFELIIIDDGSTDNTGAILEEYKAKDNRVRVILMDHVGIVSALNRGIDESYADWIARMDSDDVAHPDRLERQWRAIQEYPDSVLCHSNVRIFGEPGHLSVASRFIRSRALLELSFCYRCAIIHPTVLFKKAAYMSCGRYKEEERHAEDFGLWGRLLTNGAVIGIPQALLDFRVHGESISKLKSQAQESISRDIAIRHCIQFMDLDITAAIRAYETLHARHTSCSFSNWLRFLCQCIPRLRHHSFEMWAWIAMKTVHMATSKFSG